MNRNFRFDGMSVIAMGDRLFDLHNAYDLEHLGTDPDGAKATVMFVRNRHAIDPETLPQRVSLNCTGQVKIAFNNINLIRRALNQEGIEVAYFDQTLDWDAFIDEDIGMAQEPVGLHIDFGSGFVIRIFCELVTFDSHW